MSIRVLKTVSLDAVEYEGCRISRCTQVNCDISQKSYFNRRWIIVVTRNFQLTLRADARRAISMHLVLESAPWN